MKTNENDADPNPILKSEHKEDCHPNEAKMGVLKAVSDLKNDTANRNVTQPVTQLYRNAGIFFYIFCIFLSILIIFFQIKFNYLIKFF